MVSGVELLAFGALWLGVSELYGVGRGGMASSAVLGSAQGVEVADLPSGTVTFLFTDLEGSTRLWEQHGEAMQEPLARHDAILRGAVESHAGQVVKTTGDGIHAVFALRQMRWRQLSVRSGRWELRSGARSGRFGCGWGCTVGRPVFGRATISGRR